MAKAAFPKRRLRRERLRRPRAFSPAGPAQYQPWEPDLLRITSRLIVLGARSRIRAIAKLDKRSVRSVAIICLSSVLSWL